MEVAAIFAGVVLTAGGIIFVGGVWMLVCNDATSRDRQRLVDAIFSRPDWRELLSDYNTVSYDAHLFARAALRDPLRLYPTPLRDALAAA